MTIPTDLHQKFIDGLLLSDDRTKQSLGRLFATSAYPEFDQWFDHEKTVAKPSEAMFATIMFGCYVIAEVAGVVKNESAGTKADDRIIEIVVEHLRGMLNAGAKSNAR